MAKKLYWCTCNQGFEKCRQLIEHIALNNPSWPKTSEEDKHKQLILAEWAEQK